MLAVGAEARRHYRQPPPRYAQGLQMGSSLHHLVAAGVSDGKYRFAGRPLCASPIDTNGVCSDSSEGLRRIGGFSLLRIDCQGRTVEDGSKAMRMLERIGR